MVGSQGYSSTGHPGDELSLVSLAPEEMDEHDTYVRHLEHALEDPRNKNIALTGRYGSGKSSVLNALTDKLKEKPQHRVLQISISTLGSDESKQNLTNQIQKELVKQLLYRVEPGTIKSPRFPQPRTPDRWQTLWRASGISSLLVGVLWLFGIRPQILSSGTTGLLWDIVSLFVFLVLVTGAAYPILGHIKGREVTHLSAGGTAVSLDKKPDSIFDKYLDDIVEFFDTTKTDIVIFEDLDRFNNPEIFDSLRELNTLINGSAIWCKKDKPLRFVYAIKDSLFEKLGEDTKNTDKKAEHNSTTASGDSDAPPEGADVRDVAQAEVERANRTKFFEIVIPVVPFLTHSNARDLLSEELGKLSLPKDEEVSRHLISLVARHITDMRLLKNIRNEFIVFARRLLWIDHPTPGMTADDLFSIVVYKNFHLADFEALPQRQSALDELEKARHRVVNESIKKLRDRKAELLAGVDLQRKQEHVAEVLGKRLKTWAEVSSAGFSITVTVPEGLSGSDVDTPDFWKSVATAKQLKISLVRRTTRGPQLVFSEEQLKDLFSEALVECQWDVVDENVGQKTARLDECVARLRGADFAGLLTLQPIDGVESSFVEVLEKEIKSELARDLVRQGFLNRYYAEHASVFYGKFHGVKVANFFRNYVWPNEMDAHFLFEEEDAIKNALQEAPDDFFRSRSALNIDIVDYVLQHHPESAKELVDFLVTEAGSDRDIFLDAFLHTSDVHQETLIQLLTAHPWSAVFDHLAQPKSVPDDKHRLKLFDAALTTALEHTSQDYNLKGTAKKFLKDNHQQLKVLRTTKDPEHVKVLMDFIRGIDLTIRSLNELSQDLRQAVVAEENYELTAGNLRSALQISDNEPITLDHALWNSSVLQKCFNQLDTYLDVVSDDKPTKYVVQSEQTLRAVLQAEEWNRDDELLIRILQLSAPDAALHNIKDVEPERWPELVGANLISSTAANIQAYIEEYQIDEHIASFLKHQETFEQTADLAAEDKVQLAVAMLNSSLMDPQKSVALTAALSIGSEDIDVSDLQPREDALLAYLLKAGLVPDEKAVFEHFIQEAGWDAISEAVRVSKEFGNFMDKELVSPVLAELLEDPDTPEQLKTIVVQDLDVYLPDTTNPEALRSAATFAHSKNIPLESAQIARIANVQPEPEDVLWQLHNTQPPLGEVLSILTMLGGDYEGFRSEVGTEFSVPTSHLTRLVLERLEKNNLIQLGKTKKGHRPVTII